MYPNFDTIYNRRRGSIRLTVPAGKFGKRAIRKTQIYLPVPSALTLWIVGTPPSVVSCCTIVSKLGYIFSNRIKLGTSLPSLKTSNSGVCPIDNVSLKFLATTVYERRPVTTEHWLRIHIIYIGSHKMLFICLIYSWSEYINKFQYARLITWFHTFRNGFNLPSKAYDRTSKLQSCCRRTNCSLSYWQQYALYNSRHHVTSPLQIWACRYFEFTLWVFPSAWRGVWASPGRRGGRAHDSTSGRFLLIQLGQLNLSLLCS